MIAAGVRDSQDQIAEGELSKVADALSGLFGELPSDKQVTNKAVSMSTKMGISIFRDVSAKTVTSYTKTWEEVVDLVDEAGTYDNKSRCPLIKLGVFGNKRTKNGSMRSDENLLKVYGIECDYDGGEVTLAGAYSLLLRMRVEALLYTTPGHTREKPRWRILVPLSKAYPPSERAKFVAVINGILGGILAHESFTASQTYYIGRVKGVFYESRRVRGVPVDCLDPELTKIYPFKQVVNKPKTESQGDDPDRQCTLHAVTEETIKDIHSALMGMKSERADDRTLWINVLEALASLKETPYVDTALELAHEFSKRCAEKYDPKYLEAKWEGMHPSKITYRSIFKWAQEDGWVNHPHSAVIPFDDITEKPISDLLVHATKAPRFQFVRATKFADGPPPSWIIKGLIPEAELGVIYGASQSGKTFLVFDMVAAIARGVPWRGMRVRQGNVAYIVAEGGIFFKNRINAYTTHYKVNDLPLDVLIGGPDFLNATDIRDTIAALQKLGSVSIVVVDTYAACMTGDENSGTDAGKVIAHCKEIHNATGAMVILVHHSGKDASKGARGWSGLRAAVDFELEVVRNGDHRSVTATKQKDAEDGNELGFKLSSVVVGQDEDGFSITSCIVEHSNELPVRGRSRVDKLGSMQQKVLTTVKELFEQDESWPDRNLLEITIAKSTGKKPSNIRRAIDCLIERLILEDENGIITLVL